MENLGKRTLQVGITLGAIVGLVGCGAQADGNGASETEGVTPEAILAQQNGLSMINGLSMVNGLSMSNGLALANGLNMANGLTMANGLSMSNGLMTTSDGRRAVSYLVRCALSSGDSITKNDQNNVPYTFPGSMGLCPAWKNGGVSGDLGCQERVSACMLALINISGVHVPLMLDASYSTVGWGYNPSYPYQEGTFFGNIMTANAHGTPGINAYYCEGPDFASGVVPGRIGAGYTGAPYKNPFGTGGRCDQNCATGSALKSNGSRYDGYDACSGCNATITVYRQTSYTPVFDNGYNYQVTNAAATNSLQFNNVNGGVIGYAGQGLMTQTPAQLFKIVSEGSYYKVQLKSDTTRCLDSYWGTSLNVASCSANNSSQQFIATADSKGRFLLQNVATNNGGVKYLTLNGSTLDLEAASGNDNQAWKIGAVDLL
jgi:hypothetical protein